MTKPGETEQPVEGVTYSSNASPELFTLESQRMVQVSGLLGKLFGNSENAPTNIAGLVMMLLVFSGIAMLFTTGTSMTASEYWKIILPVITLIIGYLFGKNA
jgi:uncharacterized membrane protein HdeD (DUF308 family)